MGYYDSREDRSGEDPFIPNSQFRLLAGYEQELAKDFTGGVQYYLEQMIGLRRLQANLLPRGSHAADEFRHVITLRLTKLLMYQSLKLSLFTFYSPSDRDVYMRPNIHYRISDHWSGEVGANIFIGERIIPFSGSLG